MTKMPTMASAVVSTWAPVVLGYIEPYPMVAIVCTLKKKRSENDPGRAPTIPACLQVGHREKHVHEEERQGDGREVGPPGGAQHEVIPVAGDRELGTSDLDGERVRGLA